MNRFERSFGQWVVRHRWWIIAATVLVVLAAASGGSRLTFTNDLRVFFSKENPQLQALEALEDTYTKNENVFFVLAPKGGNVFTRKALSAIEGLTEAAWKIPYSSRVDSITNFQHTYAQGDDLIVRDLAEDAASLTDEELAAIRETALSEPALLNRLVSGSGHVTAVNVNILKPGTSIKEVPEITMYAQKMASDLRAAHPDIDVYLTGGIPFDSAFGEAAAYDMQRLVPVMFVVLLVVLGLALRSFSGTLGTFIVIAMSMLTGMGLAGWLGISLNTASANAPIIILTLAVADSIHILMTIFQQMRKGVSRHGAVAESLRINLQPVFLTSITTAIGFLSMNFSDAPPFRDLGNIVAMGIMAAFFYSVLFLPALMAVLPIKARARKAGDRRVFDGFADFVIKRKTPVFYGMLVVVALLTSGVTRIEFDDDWVKYFGRQFDIRIATDFAQEHLTGFDIVEYSIGSGEPGGINEPAYLSKLEEFAAWYRAQPKVVHVGVITDTMKRLNMDMHGGDRAFYKVPGQRELAAQYLLLYEMSLPFGLDLNNRIDVRKSATRMTVSLANTTTTELRQMDEQARAWLKENAPEHMYAYGSGMSVMFAHISRRNINAMLWASLGALVLISGILVVALRSLRHGVISLIPNLTPAFMAFGVWGMTVGQVGLGLSVVVSLTLGIVVDDTVHFMSKYIRARREDSLGPEDAVRYAFNTVGAALMSSTAALVAGFSVLAFSGFKMNSEMGLMTALTITLALLLDFLFLPTLLMGMDKGTSKNSMEEKNE